MRSKHIDGPTTVGVLSSQKAKRVIDAQGRASAPAAKDSRAARPAKEKVPKGMAGSFRKN